MKHDVRPRYSFKKKLSVVDGQEHFKLEPKEVGDVHPSYRHWCQLQILDDIKQQLFTCAEEPLTPQSLAQSRSKEFELPDGTVLTLGKERVEFPERFFNNSHEGFTGFQSMVGEAISRADLDIRKDLYANVILSGGTASLKGLEKRLDRQIPDIAP
jgi:actin-related protein